MTPIHQIEEEKAQRYYLGRYRTFVELCREEEPGISSMELSLLFHGYVTGGQ